MDLDGGFKVEVDAKLGPFEVVAEEKWHETIGIILDNIDLHSVDEIVAAAPDLYTRTDIEELSPTDRVHLGEALLLGENPKLGYAVLTEAMKVFPRNESAPAQWTSWKVGWAAWLTDDDVMAEQVFRDLLIDADGKALERERWRDGQWIAAWFLHKVTDEEFIEACNDSWITCDDSYFFIGERFLKQGKLDEASEFYQRCIDTRKAGWTAFAANWAQWRLKQIQARMNGAEKGIQK